MSFQNDVLLFFDGGENLDPEVRVIPQGSQDSIWGKSTCLHGQIGLFAVLQDSLNPQNVRTFHEAGRFRYIVV